MGLSWGIQRTPFLYNGCRLNENNYVSMYRWHLPDPIAWQKECRITFQQIAYQKGLVETEDDWSCSTFRERCVPDLCCVSSAPTRASVQRPGRSAEQVQQFEHGSRRFLC